MGLIKRREFHWEEHVDLEGRRRGEKRGERGGGECFLQRVAGCVDFFLEDCDIQMGNKGVGYFWVPRKEWGASGEKSAKKGSGVLLGSRHCKWCQIIIDLVGGRFIK